MQIYQHRWGQKKTYKWQINSIEPFLWKQLNDKADYKSNKRKDWTNQLPFVDVERVNGKRSEHKFQHVDI